MSAVTDYKVLGELPLFRGLASEELLKLNGLLHRKTFPAGATIIAVEQKGEVVYIILNGTVKVHVQNPDGRDVIIAMLGAGDIVGEMSLLDNTGRCANVVTLEESTLLWMDRSTFQECLQSTAALTFRLACILASRLRLANEQIQALAALEVESRVARQLLAFADHYGKPDPNGDVVVPIRLTQSDLASLVGASRERVNKIMVSYRERRYISVDPNYRITILNRKALSARCQ